MVPSCSIGPPPPPSLPPSFQFSPSAQLHHPPATLNAIQDFIDRAIVAKEGGNVLVLVIEHQYRLVFRVTSLVRVALPVLRHTKRTPIVSIFSTCIEIRFHRHNPSLPCAKHSWARIAMRSEHQSHHSSPSICITNSDFITKSLCNPRCHYQQ